MHRSGWVHGLKALIPREYQGPKSFSMVCSERLREAQKSPTHLVLYPGCTWLVPPLNQGQKWEAVQVGQFFNLFTFCDRTLSVTNNGKRGKGRRKEGREGKGEKMSLTKLKIWGWISHITYLQTAGSKRDHQNLISNFLHLSPPLFSIWFSFSGKVLLEQWPDVSQQLQAYILQALSPVKREHRFVRRSNKISRTKPYQF